MPWTPTNYELFYPETTLYKQLWKYLKVSTRFVSFGDGQIDNDDDFTIRITVTNTSPSWNWEGKPSIYFIDPKVIVVPGYRAKPKNPNSGSCYKEKFPDRVLSSSEPGGTYLDVEMTATGAIYLDPASTQPEILNEVARVSVMATLDQDAYFSFRKRVIHKGDLDAMAWYGD